MRTFSRLGVFSFLLFVLLVVAAFLFGVMPVREAAARSSTIWLRPGTTLAEVAWQWQTTPETLRWLNGFDADDLAWGGMALKVPPEKGLIAVPVQKGQSLAQVAADHGLPVAALMELNKVAPAKRLRTGQMLYVRSDDGLMASGEYPFHIVAAGDTLESIAARYRSTVRAIRRYNELGDAGKLKEGQRLIVPPMSPQDRLSEAPLEKSGQVVPAILDLPSLTEKWIDVDLSEQRVVAYQGARPVKTFIVSTGRSPTPTLKGVFRVEAKVPSTRMMGGSVENGDYYNLANVQWVTYFYGGYSFHGTYWHKKFGQPMSHGCVNMTNDDAKWLYEWTSPTHNGRGRYSTPADVKGTLVVVHD